MNIQNKSNQYQKAIGTVFDRIPKSVFAAIAVSALTRGGEELADATDKVIAEWWILHRNGIVPQKPTFPEPPADTTSDCGRCGQRFDGAIHELCPHCNPQGWRRLCDMPPVIGNYVVARLDGKVIESGHVSYGVETGWHVANRKVSDLAETFVLSTGRLTTAEMAYRELSASGPLQRSQIQDALLTHVPGVDETNYFEQTEAALAVLKSAGLITEETDDAGTVYDVSYTFAK